MPKNSVCIILAHIDRAIAFEWIIQGLRDEFEFHFILLNSSKESYLATYCKNENVPCEVFSIAGKKSYPALFFKIRSQLKKWRIDTVHTHLFESSILGLSAAYSVGIKKRIYTRHHSTFHHEYAPKGIRWDKLISRMATQIIAISKNVKQVLMEKEGVPAHKITLIHHGFNIKAFQNVPRDRVEAMKKKYEIESIHPIIGVIARMMEWKGIQYIVPAFKNVLSIYPNAVLFLANAHGPYKPYILELLKDIPEKNYRIVPFEKDLFTLYHLFNVFVHCPINKEIEAFGQTYVEALAAGVPSVFTISGVADEFITDKHNALVVPHKNSIAIEGAIKEILSNSELANTIVLNGKKDVQRFGVDDFCNKLSALYSK